MEKAKDRKNGKSELSKSVFTSKSSQKQEQRSQTPDETAVQNDGRRENRKCDCQRRAVEDRTAMIVWVCK